MSGTAEDKIRYERQNYQRNEYYDEIIRVSAALNRK
jgi:hypothetical protein